MAQASIAHQRNSVDTNVIEMLLYYDEKGTLSVILNYFPKDICAGGHSAERAGDFTVLVDPARQGHGIGTKLLTAAIAHWEINFKQQRYTLSVADW